MAKRERRPPVLPQAAAPGYDDDVFAWTRHTAALLRAQKHPVLRGREQDIAQVLADPDEVRRSRLDEVVHLFYRGHAPRWLCAVARREDGSGFLITAYPTDAIKAGETIWTRSR